MTEAREPAPLRAQELAAIHALGWLTVGNAVGVLLALLLLAPRLGDALDPLGYGRFMPVHWNALLYGWLSLPLVAALLRLYGVLGRAGRWAVAAWSATLLVGCLSWLAGHTTAKPFLEWSGPVRWLLAANLVFLEAVLVAGFARGRAAWTRPGRLGRTALLVALAPVPFVLFHAASPAVYPPVNPASGGPTGASLLGSSLAIVALFALAPRLLGLSSGAPPSRRWESWLFGLLALHFALFLALVAFMPGDRPHLYTHRDPLQIAAVASIALWPPLLVPYLRRFAWPPGSGRWLAALGAWSVLLVASAVPTFLPGVLERWKFTHALVAHAHLAMAGLTTAFVVVALICVVPALGPVLGSGAGFALWNGGTLVHVAAMMALGALEGGDPGLVIRGGPAVTGLYTVRLAAGVAMLLASALWLRGSLASSTGRGTGR